MQIKNIVAALAIAGLATAQTPPTKATANIKTADIEATFAFEKVEKGVSVTITAAKGLTKTLQVLDSGFQYHIHVKPVTGGDCMSTGGHLNPTNVNYTTTTCVPTDLTTCEVGDLAGKHGNLMGTEDGKISLEPYIDTQITFEGENSILGRSVVIHNNVTRIACADIVTGAAAGNGAENKDDKKPPSSATKVAGSLVLSSIAALMMFAF